MAAIAELGRALDGCRSMSDVEDALDLRLHAVIPHDAFALSLRAGDTLLPQFVSGSTADRFSLQPTPLGEGLSGWVAEHARPIVNGNPTVEPHCLHDSRTFTEASSAIAVPFFADDGSVLGVITLYATASVAFSRDHLRILESLQVRLSQALQQALRAKVEATLAEPGPLPQAVSLAAL